MQIWEYFIIYFLLYENCKKLFASVCFMVKWKKKKKILISQSIPSNHHQIIENQPTTNLPTTQTTTILAQTQPPLLRWPLKPISIDHIPQHNHHHNHNPQTILATHYNPQPNYHHDPQTCWGLCHKIQFIGMS